MLGRMINKFGVKEFVSNNRFLYWLAVSYRRICWKSTKPIIEGRKKLSLFDYKALSKPLVAYPFYYILENNYYGHGRVLSRFFKVDDYTRIEHGSFLGGYVPNHNYLKTTRSIITFSDYRKKCNISTKKQVTHIGSYINYAYSILSDEQIKIMKEELGRVLLVFPSHSIDSVHANFDIQSLIDFILIKKKQFKFDSVVVCLYWKDIELKMDRYYLECGFKIVTAGHTYDYYFLDRLKSIIELADYTMSNDVGTHVGYCIAMQKPHYIYATDVKYVADKNHVNSDRELGIRSLNQQEISAMQKKDIINKFSTWQCQITKEQTECVEYYWGKRYVK